ncbi:hypothetical protein [Marispirochaeta aestuarii]|uniref:hypothetical protein n=1 Tax=Marispirochaeta aestuarii TaxID=1963862 RepID=UPI002ABD2A03|nr:hypothetical protein [Marispirochaeta aestuarii]
MIAFMLFSPLLLPFFVLLLKENGLPDQLDWWKSLAAGVWSFLLFLFFSWILSFPGSMVPSFTADLLIWGLRTYLALGLAAVVGMLLFRSGFFSAFLSEETLMPFSMGILIPTGAINSVRYIHVQDPFVLFGLPLTEFFFLVLIVLILMQYLQARGALRLFYVILIIPVSLLMALVPAFFYSFRWGLSLAVFLVIGTGSILLSRRQHLI